MAERHRRAASVSCGQKRLQPFARVAIAFQHNGLQSSITTVALEAYFKVQQSQPAAAEQTFLPSSEYVSRRSGSSQKKGANFQPTKSP